jgi:hypothetical protein
MLSAGLLWHLNEGVWIQIRGGGKVALGLHVKIIQRREWHDQVGVMFVP